MPPLASPAAWAFLRSRAHDLMVLLAQDIALDCRLFMVTIGRLERKAPLSLPSGLASPASGHQSCCHLASAAALQPQGFSWLTALAAAL